MKKIAITGGIGSGKSFICQLFAKLEVPIFNSDIESKKCYYYPDVEEQVKALFGDDIYTAEDLIDTRKLGQIVFWDNDKLKALEAIIHPKLRVRFNDWVKLKQDSEYILYESAILFESGIADRFDLIITVDCPIDIRIERSMKRDNIDESSVKARIDKQLDIEYKKDRSNIIIINDGLNDLSGTIITLHNFLKTYASN